MRVTHFPALALLALTLAPPTTLFADYSYQETTQVTGGSLLGMMKMAGTFSSQARKATDPIVTSLYLKGNRLANVSPDAIQIIDLDKETITSIDTVKRTYTVLTFQQMKQQVAQARQQMEKKQAEHATGAPANPDADKVNVSFDVHVRSTGAEKQVSGLNTSESILTLMMNAVDQKTQQAGTMAITNDMWMVPELPGYAQMRDFYMRMAEKMDIAAPGAGPDFSKLFAQNPGATQAVADMGKEMQKLHGVPVMQIMRMGTTMNGQPLPAASEAALPADNSPAMPSAGDIAKQSATSAISSKLGLGGFGGFGHKKQAEPPPEQSSTAPPTSAVLMETQTTSSNFSSAPVDPSHFEVPAGFKLMQPQSLMQP